jgi:hypothetical protein
MEKEGFTKLTEDTLPGLQGRIPDNYLEAYFETEIITNNNTRVSHPYINCSELNLISLIKSSHYLYTSSSGLEKKIAGAMVGVSLRFLSKPISTRQLLSIFQGFSKQTLRVQLYDTRIEHLLKFDEIFQHFEQGKLFLADIHDLGHHGLQQIYLGDFTKKLGSAYLMQNDELSREIIKFIHYFSLEYSIVGESADSMLVYGCLNWQTPKKSPAELSNYTDICGKCIVNWNAVRGLLSLKRRDLEISRKYDRSPLELLDISISCSYNEEDLWKYYQSNPKKVFELIKVKNYPNKISQLVERSTESLKLKLRV